MGEMPARTPPDEFFHSVKYAVCDAAPLIVTGTDDAVAAVTFADDATSDDDHAVSKLVAEFLTRNWLVVPPVATPTP